MACSSHYGAAPAFDAQKGDPQKPAQASPALVQAIKVLATIEPADLQPQQMALLVSGSVLMCSWRFIANRVASFDVNGLGCLLEVWIVAAVSLVLGQAARVLTRHSAPHSPYGATAEAAISGDSSGGSSSSAKAGVEPFAPALPAKEGREDFVSGHAAASQPEEEEDDVGAQKRRAQAEAAAKLAACREQLQQLLARVAASSASSSGADGQLLLALAEQLFSSPLHLCEFVRLGGVPAIITAASSVLPALQQQPPQQQQLAGARSSDGALGALLQSSWVLLQVAHGPPACRAALAQPHAAASGAVLLQLAQAVMDLPPAFAGASASILRNLWWTLLVLCDSAPSAAEQLVPVLQAADAAGQLQRLVSVEFGEAPGWVAAAQVGLLVQHARAQLAEHQQQEQEQQEQQQQPAAAVLADAAVAALLTPECVAGLAHLLAQRPQLAPRLGALVDGLLHFLLTFHSSELLRLAIESHLVGPLAAHMPQRLGRLLVCQLLSSRGQEAMADIEAAYELDVPLALAQVIPLRLHIKLPAAAAQQPQLGEIQPAGEDDAELQAAAPQQQQQQQQQQLAAVGDDVYTDILACRLLLQHSRLDELLSAFTAEVVAQQQQQQPGEQDAGALASPRAVPQQEQEQQHGEEQQQTEVAAAVLALARHLMARDLELQPAQHVRGESVDDSLSSSQASSSLDYALAQPDPSGLYSAVLSGLLPPEQLPARDGPGGGGDDALLTLPPLPATAAQPEQQQQQQQQGRVVFRFGQLEHSVDAASYRRIKRASKLIGSVLSKATPGQPVTLLATPAFTDEANAWVLACLERWLASRSLAGFAPLQAAKLWVAADFLQVDELQVSCEDCLRDAFSGSGPAAAAALGLALELCGHHPASSSRLQRLAAQALLRGLAGEAGAAALARALAQHEALLAPCVLAELRDRLVTLCMLNAGLDDDTPNEAVG